MSIVPSGSPAPFHTLGDLVAEHRADGAVDVADRQVDLDRLAVVDRRLGEADQLLVERLRRPWSCATDWCIDLPVRVLRHGEDRADVEALGLPVGDRGRGCRAPRRGRSSRPPCGSRAAAMSSRTSSAMYSKKVSTNSGLPLKRWRSSGFWVATPTGQVSRWQTRIITQPDTTSGAVAKPNSSAPSRAAMTTSRPVFSWPSVCTTMRSRRPLSSSVCWVSARPSSHGAAGVLQRRQRAGAGAAVVAGDQHDVGLGLADPGGNRADADLGDELDVDPRRRVGVLQIVDQLLEVLDRVDVVVRWRADQPDARAWSAGSWRSTGTPCGRAAGRPRPAWRPGPS